MSGETLRNPGANALVTDLALRLGRVLGSPYIDEVLTGQEITVDEGENIFDMAEDLVPTDMPPDQVPLFVAGVLVGEARRRAL